MKMKRWASFAGMVLLVLAACGSDDQAPGDEVAAPTSLRVEFQDGGAHITWKDNSDNESEFMVERKTSSDEDWEIIGSVPFDTVQYHDADITAGTEYVYRVMAMPKSGGHEGAAYSDEVPFVAPPHRG